MFHDLRHLSSGMLEPEVAHQVGVSEVGQTTALDDARGVSGVASGAHAFWLMTFESGRLGDVTQTDRTLDPPRDPAEGVVGLFVVREVVIGVTGRSICWKIWVVSLIRRKTGPSWSDGGHSELDRRDPATILKLKDD